MKEELNIQTDKEMIHNIFIQIHQFHRLELSQIIYDMILEEVQTLKNQRQLEQTEETLSSNNNPLTGPQCMK